MAPSNPRSSANDNAALDGLNDTILSLYARGMTVRDIQAHLALAAWLFCPPDDAPRRNDGVDDSQVWSGRSPARVTSTSRWRAARAVSPLAAVRACRQ